MGDMTTPETPVSSSGTFFNPDLDDERLGIGFVLIHNRSRFSFDPELDFTRLNEALSGSILIYHGGASAASPEGLWSVFRTTESDTYFATIPWMHLVRPGQVAFGTSVESLVGLGTGVDVLVGLGVGVDAVVGLGTGVVVAVAVGLGPGVGVGGGVTPAATSRAIL